jgi:hypothetical protein
LALRVERRNYLRKGLPEISRQVANEAMHRHFRDAVADDRVHGFSHGAERWFVNPGKIQLRFGRGQRIHGKLALMSGNNLGMVAASHSSSNRVVGVEVVSTTFSSMFLTEVLMSVLTPIPPKSTCSSTATDCALEAAAFVADWNTVSAFCLNASRTRS